MVACKRKDEEKILHKHNLIILAQLYQTEVLFRSHDQMGHQGIDKVQQYEGIDKVQQYFCPKYEGKRTSPQAYVNEAIRRQQEKKRAMQEQHCASTNETAQEI